LRAAASVSVIPVGMSCICSIDLHYADSRGRNQYAA
jgi:hypothetical protein